MGNSNKLKHFIDNPITLEEAMSECCKNISLAAQSIAKEKLEIVHLELYISLNLSLDRLTYTKYLTISPDKIDEYKKASVIEEAAERILEDLKVFIYEQSNKSSNVTAYLDYAALISHEMTDERIQKMFEVITAKFNGKKVDKRKGAANKEG